MSEETFTERFDRVADNAEAWEAQNVADGGVCDFCCHLLTGRPLVTYVTTEPIVETVIAFDKDGTGVIDHVADEYWVCCPDCDAVIQKHDVAALVKHVAETADYDRIGVPRERGVDEARLTRLYTRFFEIDPQRVEGIPEGLREQ